MQTDTDEDQLNPAVRLAKREQAFGGNDNAPDKSANDNHTARTKAAEENPTETPSGSMNYTGGGKKNNINNTEKLKTIVKGLQGKGPLGAILLTLVVGGFAGFSSVAMLPMAINANITEMLNSTLAIINPANNNLMRFKFFNGDGSAVAVDCTEAKLACQYRGITESEMKALERNNNVKFNPEGGTPTADGKLTFDSIDVNGKNITPDNLMAELKDPNFQKAIRHVRNPLWSSFKNGARVNVRRFLGFSENPHVRATSKEDLRKKIYTEVDGGSSAKTSVATGDTSEDTDETAQDQKTSAIDDVSSELNENIDAAKAAAIDGTYVSPELPTGDIIAAATRDGTDIGDITSTGSKIWGAVNSLDFADTVCTIYQFANLAASLGRMVALVNIVRYGAIYLAAFDRIAAGDSTPEDYTELTNVLTSQNKFGQLFDASAAAQFVFMGKLTTDVPISVSAVGGSVLQNITTAIHTLHTTVGGGPTVDGSAIIGRNILKVGCNIMTNLAVQIGATAITVVSSLFTAGTTGALTTLLKTGSKEGLSLAIDFAKKVLKDKITILFSKNIAHKEEQLIARRATRKAIKAQFTDPMNIIGLGLVLTETFGLDYITQVLAGTDVLAYMDDPVQTFDAIATSAASSDYMSAIAMGGTVLSIPEQVTYNKQKDKAMAEAIAVEKASADPFDINNPYSKLGMFMSKAAIPMSTIGGSSNIFGFMKSIVALPGVAMTSMSQTAKAIGGVDPTPQNLSAFVNDTYMVENGYANNIMGNPSAGIDVAYVESHDPDTIILPAIEAGYINEDGTIPLKLADGTDNPYKIHVEEANNPARAQIDTSLFEDEMVIPEKYREIGKITEEMKFFNLLTEYRALIMPDLTNTIETPPPPATSTGTTAGGSSSTEISGDWAKPVAGSVITTAYHNPAYFSTYGWNHEGVDLRNAMDQSVYSACTGTVKYIIAAGTEDYGEETSSNTVVVDCGGGITSGYHHTKPAGGIAVGQAVSAGQLIGTSDCSGVCTGAHLHFNIKQNGDFINPRIFMESKGINLGTCSGSSYCVEGS